MAKNLEKVSELKKVSKPLFFATLGAVAVGGGVGMILGPAGVARGATVGLAAAAATMSVSTVSEMHGGFVYGYIAIKIYS